MTAKYEIIKVMPFIRAHIHVYGASESEVSDHLSGLLDGLRADLPKDCTVWEPEYKGFQTEAGQHCSTVVITLGEDKEAAERQIAQRAQKLGS